MPEDPPATPTTVYDVTKFTKNPMAVEFKGTLLGGTDGPVKITPEIETEPVTCNQAGGKSVILRIKSLNYKVTATFKEVSTVFAKVFGFHAANIGKDVVGSDLYAQSGALVLSEVEDDEKKTGGIVMTFSNMVGKITAYTPDGEGEGTVEAEFDVVPTAETYLTISGITFPAD